MNLVQLTRTCCLLISERKLACFTDLTVGENVLFSLDSRESGQ